MRVEVSSVVPANEAIKTPMMIIQIFGDANEEMMFAVPSTTAVSLDLILSSPKIDSDSAMRKILEASRRYLWCDKKPSANGN